MFKSSNAKIKFSETAQIPLDEYDWNDRDDNDTEIWNNAHEMEVCCWRIFHVYAQRYQRLEMLEQFGSSERMDSLNTMDSASSDAPVALFHEQQSIDILSSRLLLRRDKHLQWLFRNLSSLPAKMISLDASRAWIVYWITQAIGLLGGWDIATTEQLQMRHQVIGFLNSLKHPTGGYGGGPRQLAHLAPTYAAVAALINVGTEEAFASIDRHGIYKLIRRLTDPVSKGYRVHEDGELDIRGAYCAVAVASLLHIVTDDLFTDIDQYIASLQSFDGGLSGEPGLESHGGYTYCGLAALAILGKYEALNLHELLFWITSRQSDTCGGFNGRPNKLTDSCYSFWCIGSLSILSRFGVVTSKIDDQQLLRLDQSALQLYILACCQESDETIYKFKGGLRDKPNTQPDFYHTCYALSGLSLSQRNTNDVPSTVVGPSEQNLVNPTDSLYNVDTRALQSAREYFSNHPFKTADGKIGTEGAGVTHLLNKTKPI